MNIRHMWCSDEIRSRPALFARAQVLRTCGTSKLHHFYSASSPTAAGCWAPDGPDAAGQRHRGSHSIGREAASLRSRCTAGPGTPRP